MSNFVIFVKLIILLVVFNLGVVEGIEEGIVWKIFSFVLVVIKVFKFFKLNILVILWVLVIIVVIL